MHLFKHLPIYPQERGREEDKEDEEEKREKVAVTEQKGEENIENIK